MSKTNYVWDSSVVIAWLGEESGAPLADMEEVVREIDDGKANLIFSVVTFTEVLESKCAADKFALFDKFLLRSNVIKIDTTFPIARKAMTIRDAALQEKPARRIKTPDATILAVAMLQRAHVLHSLDKDMLGLNGSNIVGGLCITKPCSASGQRSLFSPPS